MTVPELFDLYNRVGAHVDKLEPRSLYLASWGSLFQVRVLAQTGPEAFVIVWWAPWSEGEQRGTHVVTVVKADASTPAMLELTDHRGARWYFSELAGDAEQAIVDYHNYVAHDPKRFAELELAMLESARGVAGL